MKNAIVIATLAGAVALGGCASDRATHEHPELLGRIQAAEKAAADAQAAAARAQARADEAAATAAANNDKIDRAFQKSQQK
jgi:hypothetical protein